MNELGLETVGSGGADPGAEDLRLMKRRRNDESPGMIRGSFFYAMNFRWLAFASSWLVFT